MADNNKYVNAKMWSDNWFLDLDNHEKIIFIHLLTCMGRKMSGIITVSEDDLVTAINPKKTQRRARSKNGIS